MIMIRQQNGLQDFPRVVYPGKQNVQVSTDLERDSKNFVIRTVNEIKEEH